MLQVSRPCTSPRSGNGHAPFGRLPPMRNCTSRVRAADKSRSEPTIDVSKLGVIPFDDDCETLLDAMAFTGPAPEVGCAAPQC